MTVKLLLSTMLAGIVLSLSGCVVFDRGGYDHGYAYGQHRDRGDNRGYDRDYDNHHDNNRDYHYR
jgi:hypothetical protein